MLPSTSNIRVFVQWAQQTVFAGEDIECEITFKNVATIPDVPRSVYQSNSFNGFAQGGERQRKTTPLQSSGTQLKNTTGQNPRPPVSGRGHQTTLSLNVPNSDDFLQRGSAYRSGRQGDAASEPRPHRRSISIVTLGITERAGEESTAIQNVDDRTRRPSRGHVRASSLQILPRRSGTNGNGPSPGWCSLYCAAYRLYLNN